MDAPTAEQTLLENLHVVLGNLLVSNCLVDVREGIQTFLIYVNNVIKHPDQPKFRKIRVGNVNYQVRLGHLEGGQNLLECLGYIQDNNGFLVLPSNTHTSLELSVIKKAQQIAYRKLDDINRLFQNVPRHPSNHVFSSIFCSKEAHDIGRRNSMEDDFLSIDNFCGRPDQGLFCVFDGHGGRATVDFLTRSFHLNLEHYLSKNANVSIPRAFEDVYSITDAQIHRQQIYQSGSTSVTCLIRQENDTRMLYSANCGDTRAILCRRGKAIRLTKDHKATDKEEMKRVQDDGGFIGRFGRVNGLLAISRAFGDHLLKPAVSVQPFIRCVELIQDDYFLLLACDGVWDVMTDQEACDFIIENTLNRLNAETWSDVQRSPQLTNVFEEITLALIRISIEKRSLDNISVMILTP